MVYQRQAYLFVHGYAAFSDHSWGEATFLMLNGADTLVGIIWPLTQELIGSLFCSIDNSLIFCLPHDVIDVFFVMGAGTRGLGLVVTLLCPQHLKSCLGLWGKMMILAILETIEKNLELSFRSWKKKKRQGGPFCPRRLRFLVSVRVNVSLTLSWPFLLQSHD